MPGPSPPPGSPSTAPAATTAARHERPAGDDVSGPHGIRPAGLGALLGARRHRLEPTRPTPCCAPSPTAMTTSPSRWATCRTARDGAEEAWCRFVTRRVGAEHPFELVSGNHESNGENGDIERFARCLPNRLPGLVGSYGRQWYVDQPAAAPARAGRDDLAGARLRPRRVVLRRGHPAPRLAAGGGHRGARGRHPVGRRRHAQAVPVGRQLRVRPRAATSSTCCSTPASTSCVTGHEHLYQRTQPLALGPGCRDDPPGPLRPRLRRDRRRGHHVRDGRHRRHAAARRARRGDCERRYFAALSGNDRDPSFGSLDVQVTRRPADARLRAGRTAAPSPTGRAQPLRVRSTCSVIAARARRPSGVGSRG